MINNSKISPWGKATDKSLEFFSIGQEKMPYPLIKALIVIKRAAAKVHLDNETIDAHKAKQIIKACDDLLIQDNPDYFPLSIWQTGSGTQTNMNVNEVIAHFASTPEVHIHPNDDVNRSQSSNDVFPSALHMLAIECSFHLIQTIQSLKEDFEEKANRLQFVPKVGRTHLQDAVYMSVGQEFMGFAGLLDQNLRFIQQAQIDLFKLPLGGTAIGTGINTIEHFGSQVCQQISLNTQLPYIESTQKFSDISAKTALNHFAQTVSIFASNYYKIVNDLRWLSSGPKAGLQEIVFPANEAGSSIMPGKVNPTQCESAMMIALHAQSLLGALNLANSQGNFQLNTMMPLMAHQIETSCRLLKESIEHFQAFALDGLVFNQAVTQHYVETSYMIATKLNPLFGYDQVTQWVLKAQHEDLTIEEILKRETTLSSSEIKTLLDPMDMIYPIKKDKS